MTPPRTGTRLVPEVIPVFIPGSLPQACATSGVCNSGDLVPTRKEAIEITESAPPQADVALGGAGTLTPVRMGADLPEVVSIMLSSGSIPGDGSSSVGEGGLDATGGPGVGRTGEMSVPV